MPQEVSDGGAMTYLNAGYFRLSKIRKGQTDTHNLLDLLAIGKGDDTDLTLPQQIMGKSGNGQIQGFEYFTTLTLPLLVNPYSAWSRIEGGK